MHPVLFELFGIAVPSYGILFLSGILTAVLVSRMRAPAYGFGRTQVTDFVFVTCFCGLLGAKAMLLVVDVGQAGLGALDWRLVLRGGGVWYGGVFGVIAGGGLFSWYNGLDCWALLNTVFPGAALGHAVGRVGCFLAGCCYGSPTRLPWGVTFTDPLCARNSGTPLNVPLHPVQLYEAGAEVVIASALLLASRRLPGKGLMVPLYLILYAPVRFALEEFRSDFRGLWLKETLSTSQILAAGTLLGGVALMIHLRRRQATSAGKETESRRRRRRGGAHERPSTAR